MQNCHLDIQIQCLIFYFLTNSLRNYTTYSPLSIFRKRKCICQIATNAVPNWHPKSLCPINWVPTRYHSSSILLYPTLPLKKQNSTYPPRSPLPAPVWILALQQFLVLHLEKQLCRKNNRLYPPTQPLRPYWQTP